MKKFVIMLLCGMLSACHSLLFYWKNPRADIVSMHYILNYEIYIKKYGFEEFAKIENPVPLDMVKKLPTKDKEHGCSIFYHNVNHEYPFKAYMQEIFPNLHQTNLHIKLNQEKISLSYSMERNYMGGVRRLLDENKIKLIWLKENEACISTPVRLGHLMP